RVGNDVEGTAPLGDLGEVVALNRGVVDVGLDRVKRRVDVVPAADVIGAGGARLEVGARLHQRAHPGVVVHRLHGHSVQAGPRAGHGLVVGGDAAAHEWRHSEEAEHADGPRDARVDVDARAFGADVADDVRGLAIEVPQEPRQAGDRGAVADDGDLGEPIQLNRQRGGEVRVAVRVAVGGGGLGGECGETCGV